MSILPNRWDVDPLRTTVRVAVSGLARAGKTSFLTSVAVNLLAGKLIDPAPDTTAVAPAGAASLARFDAVANAQAMARDPPEWPKPTDDVALLAIDLTWRRGRMRPDRRVRLELLDYPGEWLLDLPLLSTSYARWSEQVLARLERIPAAHEFMGFVQSIERGAGADEGLAADGSRRYRALLTYLSKVEHLSLLQPGRFLMKPPGNEPPYMKFFPFDRSGPLARLLAERYDAYVRAVRAELSQPSFARIDRMVVLADVLTALHAGQAAFQDVRAALATVSEALRWRNAPDFLPERVASLLPLGGIKRVAFVASKADLVGEAQRHNLAELVNRMTPTGGQAVSRSFAIASVRSTEDCQLTLGSGNGAVSVSGVRGKVATQMLGFYPGEISPVLAEDRPWNTSFLKVPEFDPVRFDAARGDGIPNIGLKNLFAFLLEGVL